MTAEDQDRHWQDVLERADLNGIYTGNHRVTNHPVLRIHLSETDITKVEVILREETVKLKRIVGNDTPFHMAQVRPGQSPTIQSWEVPDAHSPL